MNNQPKCIGCTNGVYSRKINRELSLLCLSNLHLIMGIKANMGFLEVVDEQVKQYMATEKLEERLNVSVQHLGLEWPPILSSLDNAKLKLKQTERERWLT